MSGYYFPRMHRRKDPWLGANESGPAFSESFFHHISYSCTQTYGRTGLLNYPNSIFGKAPERIIPNNSLLPCNYLCLNLNYCVCDFPNYEDMQRNREFYPPPPSMFPTTGQMISRIRTYGLDHYQFFKKEIDLVKEQTTMSLNVQPFYAGYYYHNDYLWSFAENLHPLYNHTHCRIRRSIIPEAPFDQETMATTCERSNFGCAECVYSERNNSCP